MKKLILLSCFAAMTAATSIQAELPLMVRINRNLEATQQRIQRDPAFTLTPKSCADCITMGNLCPALRTKYPDLYKRVDAIVAQNGICTRCMNVLKTLAQKGGAPVARFISAGLEKIKNNPKKSIALAAVTLPVLVYGAAQLCVTYGAAATLAQPMSTAAGTTGIAQTIIDAYDGYIFSPVSHAAATACNWTMQTAAGQKVSAAGSYVSSTMSSFWNSTKALAHDMWNRNAIAGDLKTAQAESQQAADILKAAPRAVSLHAQEMAYNDATATLAKLETSLKAEQALFNATHQTASLSPTAFAPVTALGPDCNVTSIDKYLTASRTCADAHDTFADAGKVLAAARDYNNQPTWFGGRLWRSLWAPDTTRQILDANAKVQAATRTVNTECAQVATAKATLGTACNATILDEYVKTNRACAQAHGTISQAKEALEAAKDYNNQPASWKNLYGLWKTANGPDAVQQIRNARLNVESTKQAETIACEQAETAYNAVKAMQTQVAAAHAAAQAMKMQTASADAEHLQAALATHATQVNQADHAALVAAIQAAYVNKAAAQTAVDTARSVMAGAEISKAAAAQATMTRTAQVIEGLKTRLGNVNFARNAMYIETALSTLFGAGYLALKAGLVTTGVIAKSDKWARFKNWCSSTLCRSQASAPQSAAASH